MASQGSGKEFFERCESRVRSQDCRPGDFALLGTSCCLISRDDGRRPTEHVSLEVILCLISFLMQIMMHILHKLLDKTNWELFEKSWFGLVNINVKQIYRPGGADSQDPPVVKGFASNPFPPTPLWIMFFRGSRDIYHLSINPILDDQK